MTRHHDAGTVRWRPMFLSILLISVGVAPVRASSTSVDPRTERPVAGQAVEAITPQSTGGAAAGRPSSPDGTISPAATTVAPRWRVTAFPILRISPYRRFEVRIGGLTTAWPPTRVHDRYGVPMRIIGGVRRYHPVGLTRLGLAYLSSYRRTHDRLFLDRATRIAAGLRRIAVSARGSIWFPYRFTWTMHGVARYVNRPPWYSGMSQGLALALFVRLWEYTRDDAYRQLADRTYNSLRNMGRGSEPWVSWIDGGRYLWIEEYPQQLDRTFNGYVFALIGLHDYSQLTKDPALYVPARNADVLALLRGGITTIRAFTPTFRNPGTVSDYCLAHHYRNAKYHPVHIRQLRYLGLMTGDPWFGRMADLFAADTR